MTAAQHAQQARAFLDWRRRTPLDWETALVRWSLSKDLAFGDYSAIRAVVHAELIARGEVTLTDVPDFEPEDVEV